MFTRDCVKFSCFESLVDPRRPFANLQHCLLDTAAFYECLQNWIESLKLDLTGKGIHIDGKTARHSFDGASNLKAMHLVSAWVDELSICLGQVATDEKSNEITAVPLLLDMLEIKGAAVTLDAGCNFYRGQEPDSQRERASNHGGLRRFVLSLLKRDTSLPKTSMRRKRLRAALNTKTLEALLAAI